MQFSKSTRGFSTIELLLAFGVGISFLSASLMLIATENTSRERFSLDANASITLSMSKDSIGHEKTKTVLEATRALLTANWHHRLPTSTHTGDGFIEYPPKVVDISPCLKQVTARTEWATGLLNLHFSDLDTTLGNQKNVRALGGDCEAFPTTATWSNLHLHSSYATATSIFGALDVLDHKIYTTDELGNLSIFASEMSSVPQLEIFGTFPTGAVVNDIDVARWTHPTTNEHKTFAYVMRHSTTTQLQIIDVTNPSTPTSIPAMTKTLTGQTPPRGSFPQGWRLRFYDNFVYALTRETAGFEFHIFDVSDSENPLEAGPGLEINGTANDMTVVGIPIDGEEHRLVFLATERSAAEIMVLNVTNPLHPTVLTTVDAPTNLDAMSINVLGNKLYLGRQQFTNGPELTVYELTVSSTTPLQITLAQVGPGANTGGGITNMRSVGEKVFISTTVAGDSFQVWDTSNAETGLVRLNSQSLGTNHRITGRIDYGHPNIYATGERANALLVFSSSP